MFLTGLCGRTEVVHFAWPHPGSEMTPEPGTGQVNQILNPFGVMEASRVTSLQVWDCPGARACVPPSRELPRA